MMRAGTWRIRAWFLLALALAAATPANARAEEPNPKEDEQPVPCPAVPDDEDVPAWNRECWDPESADENVPRPPTPIEEQKGVLGLPSWLISEEPVPKLNIIDPDLEAFPAGNLFYPLLADPTEVRAEGGFGRISRDLSGRPLTIGSLWIGVDWGVLRHTERTRQSGTRDGWQLGLEAMATVLLGYTDPFVGDLINADFLGGVNASYRWGNLSGRLRAYHESTHLGDEFVFITGLTPAQRLNVSYEAIEFQQSIDYKELRLSAGGEFRTRIDPDPLKRWEFSANVEWRSHYRLFVFGRPLVGYNVRFLETHDYRAAQSLVAGLQLGNPRPYQMNFKLLFRMYDGPSPYGQFRITSRDVREYLVTLRWSP
ncbi:MAG: DUF1207 domain-containing protein [Chrysiogenetes bacterium]|nr:DUF1207 domain-containing protein [Chrysiogenetes bacterium]